MRPITRSLAHRGAGGGARNGAGGESGDGLGYGFCFGFDGLEKNEKKEIKVMKTLKLGNMNKTTYLVMVVLMIGLGASSLLHAHGVEVAVGKKYPSVFLQAGYDGGSPLAAAPVTVYFENRETVHQTGNTDVNGNFAFCPNKTGKWIVAVDDLMGHIVSEEVTVDDAFFNAPVATDAQPNASGAASGPASGRTNQKIPVSKNDLCCYLLKVVFGLLLIGGITFLMHRWSKKNAA